MAETNKTEPAPEIDSLSFEAAFGRLGEMAEALEEGGLTLAEATARYEEGMKLVQRCNRLLDEAEIKITTLKNDYAMPPDHQSFTDDDDPSF